MNASILVLWDTSWVRQLAVSLPLETQIPTVCRPVQRLGTSCRNLPTSDKNRPDRTANSCFSYSFLSSDGITLDCKLLSPLCRSLLPKEWQKFVHSTTRRIVDWILYCLINEPLLKHQETQDALQELLINLKSHQEVVPRWSCSFRVVEVSGIKD